jgi:hypothetical protein
MSSMIQADREKLVTAAREGAAQYKSSDVLVTNLTSYCLEHGITASISELFDIAEDAIARQQKLASGPAEQAELPPRASEDRRKREQRQHPRRIAARRRTGLVALVEDFRRLGRPEHRSSRDRRSGRDRRELMRRMHVRRQSER